MPDEPLAGHTSMRDLLRGLPVFAADLPEFDADAAPEEPVSLFAEWLAGAIEAPSGGVACHVGIYFRTVTWNDRKVDIGGIGGVATRPDCRRLGYASLALNAAIQTMRHQEAVRFGLLFCEPHNFAFYQSRGWHPFSGEIHAEQPGGKIRFETMAPFVFDFGRAPRQGVIDLCGLPW